MNELNILVEDDRPPIYVTREEYELYRNAVVVEDVRHSYPQRKWAQLIKEKYNSQCQCCGSKENLEAHHALSFKYYPALRLDLNNGVCLCKKCHVAYHKQYSLKDSSSGTLLDFVNKYNENKK